MLYKPYKQFKLLNQNYINLVMELCYNVFLSWDFDAVVSISPHPPSAIYQNYVLLNTSLQGYHCSGLSLCVHPSLQVARDLRGPSTYSGFSFLEMMHRYSTLLSLGHMFLFTHIYKLNIAWWGWSGQMEMGILGVRAAWRPPRPLHNVLTHSAKQSWWGNEI